jgi:fimbrial chaperone protein
LARASFDINPISLNLAPSGARAIGSYSITNTSAQKVPIQIYIVPRKPDADGKEVYTEGGETDDQFQIYPSQVILNPGERRTVRVSWVGTSKPKGELSFRMISEELPFDVDNPNQSNKFRANVKIASKYIGSIYITPLGAQPNLVAKGDPAPGATPQLNLTIENLGAAHFVLQKVRLKLTSTAKPGEIEIPSDQLTSLYNQNVLAGLTRRFVLPWPKNLPVGPVKVIFEALKD